MKNETYFTTKKIRGEKRKVKISFSKDGKKHTNVITPKKRKRKIFPISKARKHQATRSKTARTRDSKSTSKNVIRDSRWKKNPGSFDYPGIDTKGKGKNLHKDKVMAQRQKDRTKRKKALVSDYRKAKSPKQKEKIKAKLKKLEKLKEK